MVDIIKFLKEQKVKETGAFSKGVNKGLNIAISAIKNPEICPTIEQPQWISCAERLPELHTKVLCCGKKGGRFIAELHTWGRDNALYWTKRDGKGCPTVTHWMPLPQPPKGDE